MFKKFFSKNTLNSLAKDSHTYWKFSQSKPGLSIESNIFAEYKENTITKAKDKDKLLSFTNEENIFKCFMYGDQLTELCFSNNNPLFKKIKNNSYRYIPSALCEYETKKLVTKKNYSLKSKSTIRLLIEFIPEGTNFSETGWFGYKDSFEERLRSFGFIDSANLISEIHKQYKHNMWLTKYEALEIVDNFKEF